MREIELAKYQLIADQLEASGIVSISNYGNCTRIHLNEQVFYRLFGDRTANEVKVEFGNSGAVHVETQLGNLEYSSILLIEEEQDDQNI